MLKLKNSIIFLFTFLFSINLVFSTPQILGLVQDEYDNLIVGADLNFQCAGIDPNFEFPKKTNSYGGFELKNFSFSNCRIFASLENKIGFTDIINDGNQTFKINLLLNKEAVAQIPKTNSIFSFGFLILLVIIFAFILHFYRISKENKLKSISKKVNKNNNQINSLEKEIEVNEEKIESLEKKKEEFENGVISVDSESRMTSWMSDIIKTLINNERDIVETLIDLNGEATVSKIRLKSGIAKTSVFRLIHSLEKKKILELEDFGKMKKVKLSNFFLKK